MQTLTNESSTGAQMRKMAAILASDTRKTDYDGYDIAHIARVIREMKIPVSAGAEPYFRAMLSIYSFFDKYGQDSASSIVCYFLANAQTMKGDIMREIKAELNKQLKAYYKATA